MEMNLWAHGGEQLIGIKQENLLDFIFSLTRLRKQIGLKPWTWLPWFHLSSLIPSLSSLKERRLRWRRKSLMFKKKKKNHTYTHTHAYSHTLTVQPRFTNWQMDTHSCFVWLSCNTSREKGPNIDQAVRNVITLLQTLKLWWKYGWCSWLAAVVCNLDNFFSCSVISQHSLWAQSFNFPFYFSVFHVFHTAFCQMFLPVV